MESPIADSGILRTRFLHSEEKHQSPGNRDARKSQERCAIASVYDHKSREGRRYRRANALRRHDGALRDIEAPCAAHQVGHDDGKNCPEDSRSDTVQCLHGDQPKWIIRKRVKEAAQRQDEEGGEEERLTAPFVRARSDQHRHWHHNNLGGHDANRHETCSEIFVLERKLLPD